MSGKILLDTDIGSDIDDAICLAYLLSQPECELLGVTTVSGESEKRAMMASVICTSAGRSDIPIFPGTELPLLTPQKQPVAYQAVKMPDWEHKTDFPPNAHIEFMRRTIKKYPGEVTLLGIGPMTNIALLFSVDPEIPLLLKQLVIMCGIFTFKTPLYTCLTEWNASCDPYATAIVYNAPVKTIKSVGLDVTTHVTMDKKEFIKKIEETKNEIFKPVIDFLSVRSLDGFITFHDPLAAAVIFDEAICGFESGTIETDIESSRSKGLLYFDKSLDSKNKIAMYVDRNKFFGHFFEIINKS
ncbi:MAG: nucleoside hydrolase [Oscillospiraceae bacterium]|nr:nucleoside hydrolase [Oscillospiraceae bacterium]